ncbi:MAG: rhomboid family intramembrane serine protease [Bdellovibrionota bacterium]
MEGLTQTEEPRIIRKIRANWLTRKPDPNAFFVALLSSLLLALGAFFFWSNFLQSQAWMTGIREQVYGHREYWRAWTALLAHGDLGHLLSNEVLFFAFAYLLFGQFGAWAFPGAALFFGGITNLLVLRTMPPAAELLGISGVVYWMGGAWLALYFLLENRDRFSHRAIKAVGVGVVLFIPETIYPNVSYLSHFIGFLLGTGWAYFYYRWNRKKFMGAVLIETSIEEPVPFDYEKGYD